ncbi:uncharacterized protein LOC119670212 [Teleopsis dalmanni]|uniref:uncharacterized protein LOC119670212 n=1 Tax=Teleopsis dalmanni TaxID=139649 RepID=UPI0018CE642B|nr:uncharacterized protein LOC119670212 [Teleopsis dalmanni]
MSQKLSFAAGMDNALYEQQMQNRNAIASTTLTSATRPSMHQFENELQQRLHHYQHQQHALDRFQTNRMNFSNYSNAYPYNIPYAAGTFGQHARTNPLRASPYDYEAYINRARYSSYQHQIVPSSVLHYPPRNYPFQQHQLMERQHTNIYQSQSPYYMQQYQQQQSHHPHQQQFLAAQRSPYLEMHLNEQASLAATNPSVYTDSANLTLQQLEQQRQLHQRLHYQQIPAERQNLLSPTQCRDAYSTDETTSLLFQQQHKSYPNAQDALQVSNQRNATNPSESVHINPAEYSHNFKNDLGQVPTPLNNVAQISEEEVNTEESGRAQLVISPPMLSATGTDSGVSSCSGSSNSNYQCVDDKDFICLNKESSPQYESAPSDRESKNCNENIKIKSEKIEELQATIKTEAVANGVTEADIKVDIDEVELIKVKTEENPNDEVEQLDTFKPKLDSNEQTGSISINSTEAPISTNSSPTTDRALTPRQHLSTNYGSKAQYSTNRQFDDNSWSPFPTSPSNSIQHNNFKSISNNRNLTPSPIPIVPQNSPVDYSMQSIKKKHIIEYDLIPSKKKTKRRFKAHGNEKNPHEEIRNTKPLPGFQQAFGTTEIGRFSETFLFNADNATNFLGDIEHQAEFYPEYSQQLSAYENVDNRNTNNETHYENFPCNNTYNMTPYERYLRANKRLNEINCNDNDY